MSLNIFTDMPRKFAGKPLLLKKMLSELVLKKKLKMIIMYIPVSAKEGKNFKANYNSYQEPPTSSRAFKSVLEVST